MLRRRSSLSRCHRRSASAHVLTPHEIASRRRVSTRGFILPSLQFHRASGCHPPARGQPRPPSSARSPSPTGKSRRRPGPRSSTSRRWPRRDGRAGARRPVPPDRPGEMVIIVQSIAIAAIAGACAIYLARGERRSVRMLIYVLGAILTVVAIYGLARLGQCRVRRSPSLRRACRYRRPDQGRRPRRRASWSAPKREVPNSARRLPASTGPRASRSISLGGSYLKPERQHRCRVRRFLCNGRSNRDVRERPRSVLGTVFRASSGRSQTLMNAREAP
jgi:hypothetical protein